MNIFNNINQNNNTTEKGKTENGVGGKDFVNFEQLEILGNSKLDKDSSSIMFFEKENESNNSLLRNVTIPPNTINSKTLTTKSQNSNTVAWATENKLHAIYNDKYVTIQTGELNNDSIELIGEHFLVSSNHRTVPTAIGSTKMYDLRTLLEIPLPSQIDTTKRHYIKYLKSLNKVAFVRFDTPKMFLLTFDNIFSKVVKTEEITLNSTISSPIVEANETHYILMNRASNNVVSCIKISDGLVDSTLSTTIGNTFNNKQIFDMCYVNGQIVVTCKMSSAVYDLCVAINNNGSLIQLPVTTDLSILADNTNFRILPIGKSIILVQLNVIENVNVYNTQMYLIDVSNNKLLKTYSVENKSFVNFYDAIINNDGDIFDYSFNQISTDIAYLISACKPLLFSNRTIFGDSDILNYGELINLLQNADSIITDDSFFVKTISSELGDIDVLKTLNSYDGKRFQIEMENTTIQPNTIFENAWARLEFVNGQYTFVPINIEYFSSNSIGVILLQSFDIENLNKITIASNIKTSTQQIDVFEKNQKTNGYKVTIDIDSLSQIEYDVISEYILINELQDLVVESENYAFDMVNTNSQILLTKNTTSNIISTKDLYVFTNMGDNTNTPKNRKSSKSVFYCTSGNESVLSVDASYGVGLFMYANGGISGGVSEIVATTKIALLVSKFMKETSCSVDEAIYFITQTSTNPNYNTNFGYGSIVYEDAITYFNNFWYKQLANKKKSYQKTSKDIDDNTLVSKRLIPLVNDDINNVYIELERGFKGTKIITNNFIIGSYYVVDSITNGDDLTNLGFKDVGVAFKAKETTATTFTTSEIFNFDSNIKILNTNSNVDDYIETIGENIIDETVEMYFSDTNTIISIIGDEYTKDTIDDKIRVKVDMPQTDSHKKGIQLIVK